MAAADRRDFLKTSLLASAGYWVAGGVSAAPSRSPNEKLNLALIGCGGQGGSNLNNVASENIVALCDVDEVRAAKAFEKYPSARRFQDFRQLFDKDAKHFDAVVVSTPDHCHAPAALAAMELGKHVYCEKPLTHSVYEARQLRQMAARQKVATQMGNHGHAVAGVRRTVELVQLQQALGPVSEVHCWTDRPIWPQGIARPTEAAEVPRTLAWDLWLGPAPARPYHAAYAPFNWRGWWDFGTGALGDMACHVVDMAFWGLGLTAPTRVSAESGPINGETAPTWSTIRYEFPARGEQPPVLLTWYDGKRDGQPNLPPASLVGGRALPENGTILVGRQGTLLALDPYAATYVLLPEEKFQGFRPPAPTLPDSPGHHAEWIAACKGGPAALSNFDYAGRLTEALLLGNVALRAGQPIEWNAELMEVTNCPEAMQYVRRDYRPGWGA